MWTPHWVKRKIEAGNIEEEYLFLASRKRPSKGASIKKSESEKAWERFRYRVRNLSRLINTNFTPGDLLVTLTYNRESYTQLKTNGAPQERVRDISYHAAKKELHLFLQRCKYLASQQGVTFRAVYITSDMRGATHHYARVHHHLVINSEAKDIVSRCWKNGIIKFRALRNQADYAPLARYLLEQTRVPEGSNSFGHTQNLQKPTITDQEWNDSDALFEVPEDANVITSGPYYIKYSRKR